MNRMEKIFRRDRVLDVIDVRHCVINAVFACRYDKPREIGEHDSRTQSFELSNQLKHMRDNCLNSAENTQKTTDRAIAGHIILHKPEGTFSSS